jgi:hypothetical protein
VLATIWTLQKQVTRPIKPYLTVADIVTTLRRIDARRPFGTICSHSSTYVPFPLTVLRGVVVCATFVILEQQRQ